MSAIAGEIALSGGLAQRIEEFEEMKKALLKRGPDNQALYVTDKAAFIQNVLSLSVDEIEPLPYFINYCSRKYLILLDGALSNREQIKNKILEKGVALKSGNDFELILLGYILYGKDIVNMINGAYAFAIYDFENCELLLVRDRMGIKPLFYSNVNGNLIFASEIKGLLENREIRPAIGFEAIMEIMLLGPSRTLGYGVFKDICELKPGELAVLSPDGFYTERYWSITAREHIKSFEETVDEIKHLVTDCIETQLESDLPVCTMLSGGLDSSIITAVAQKASLLNQRNIKTFSVTYTDNDKYFKKSAFQPDSDTKYIKIMKERFGIENETVEIETRDLLDAVYDAVDARDLPGMADVDSSLLVFLKKIREQYKITLSGECSDELFCGYPWYYKKSADNPDGFPWSHSDIFRKGLIKDELLNGFDTKEYVYSKYIETVKSAPMLNKPDTDKRNKELMKLNMDWFMMTLVDRTDRMCSCAGVDVRVPFCDYRIAQYMYNVPWEYKYHNSFEKGLLREAFKDLLPEEIAFRKKSPYPKTHNPEYLKLVRKELENLISDASAPIFEFVKREELKKLIDGEMKTNFYGQLMTTAQTIAYFLQVDYWLRKYNIEIEL